MEGKRKGIAASQHVRVKSAIATLWAGSFLQSSSAFFVLLALPIITEDLNSSIFVIIWIILGQAIVSHSLTIPMSRIGDMYGRKLIFLIGFAISIAALGLASIAADATQLIAFRMLQGFGGSMTFGMAMALVVDVAPKSSRGRAIGISTSGIAMGSLAGPLMGGILLTIISWRGLFGILAVANLAVLIAAIFLLPKIKPVSNVGRRFDWQGGLTFATALSTFILGLTWSGDPAIGIERSLFMFVIATSSFIAFLLIERKKENPMLDLNLFRIPNYGGAVSVAIPVAMSIFSVPLIMVFFLQSILGMSTPETAIIIVFLPAVQLFNALGGWISDKVGSRIPMTLGISSYILAFLTLSFRAPVASTPELMALMALAGLGSVLTSAPLTSMALGSLPRSSLGIGAGVLANFRHVGALIAQAIVVMILGIVMGQGVSIGGVFGGAGIINQSAALVGIQWIFLFSASYCTVALVLLLLLVKRGLGGKDSINVPESRIKTDSGRQDPSQAT